MSTQYPAPTHPPADYVAGLEPHALPDRYQVHSTLGRGGMAIVYAAVDTVTGERVALKRLSPASKPESQKRNLTLFEREYHALAQLVHPRVVEVRDFGVDREGAYYAMELLEGEDLQQLGRVPWRSACSMARDVCSALSLLHSRRLVHRDVSPRNVRCTKDGRAKLLDFGAVAPVGPSKLLVGTPPCCAPESLHLQALDGRTDLYSLGATLYFMLVGHHAYAARRFSVLQDAWHVGFARPSELVDDLPEALDELVVDLLRLDPDARPANAAEVLQRLAAIDGASLSDELAVAQAYLSSPTLVGRQEPLARVSRRLRRSLQGQARCVLVESVPGGGRSRFVEACLLEATLLGACVLRADADDASSGDYGVLRALAQQLLTIMPQAARDAAQSNLGLLAQAVPELLCGAASGAFAVSVDSHSVRPHLQPALCRWLLALSQQYPLAIAVDDIDRSDEPSAAVLALLATEADEHALCLITSAQRDATWSAPAARKPLRDASTLITLDALSPEQSLELLGSLFGSVPNLGMLADRAHALCRGNPRDLMGFAQHLLDRGIVRHDGGAFSLPAQIDAADLPANFAQTLQARIAALPQSARELACALALCPEQRFSPAQCARLNACATLIDVLDDIAELIRTDVARLAADRLSLTHASLVSVLRQASPPEQTRTLHERLAEILAERAELGFFCARHWFAARQPAPALDVLVAYCNTAQANAAQAASANPGRHAQPDDWLETYARALQACDELGRPPSDKAALLRRVVGLCAFFENEETRYLSQLLAQLRRESGLDDWAALDGALPPAERVTRALQTAHARYLATPDNERVRDPVTAIRELATVVFGAVSVIGPALDLELLESLPDLTPFAALSPAVQLIDGLLAGMRARLTGRVEQARAIYADLLELVSRPGGCGLTPTQTEYFRLGLINVQATIAAGSGMASCLPLAEVLEHEPRYELNAALVRTLHGLFQADPAAVETARKQADHLRIQSGHSQVNTGLHLIWEIDAHAISEDLTRLKQAIDEIAPLAKRHPGWAPVLRYATAEYQRIRRAGAKARAEIEAALELARPGRHQLWANIASSHVLILYELGEHAAAVQRADAYVTIAHEQLGIESDRLRLAHSLVCASAGRQDASAAADAVIERMRSRDVTGLYLGLAHETRARIALLQKDVAGYEQHAAACREAYCAHKHPALKAKYQRLRHAARHSAETDCNGAAVTPDSVSCTTSRIGAALEHCRDSSQRAQLALTMMASHSGASAGLLFTLDAHGPVCAAQYGDVELTSEALTGAAEYLHAQGELADTTCTATGSSSLRPQRAQWLDAGGQRFRPMLLSHSDEGAIVVTGVALLITTDEVNFVYPTQIASEFSRVYGRWDEGSGPTVGS